MKRAHEIGTKDKLTHPSKPAATQRASTYDTVLSIQMGTQKGGLKTVAAPCKRRTIWKKDGSMPALWQSAR